VSGAGEAVVQLGTLGEAVVGVAMARAHHCNSQARVRVEQPLKLSLGLHMQGVMLGNSSCVPGGCWRSSLPLPPPPLKPLAESQREVSAR